MNIRITTQLRTVLAFTIADVPDAALDAIREHLCESENIVTILLQHGMFEIAWCIPTAAATTPGIAPTSLDLTGAAYSV